MKFNIQSKPKCLMLAGLIFFLNYATSANAAAFSDVASAHPNAEAIQYVQDHGIVHGYPDGTFRPDDLMNRAEFTKIIIEAYYSGQAIGSNCFPDVGTDWYAQYVCFAKTRNFIAGYPDGNFYPANHINFVEVAKILANANGFLVTSDPVIWYQPYVEVLADAKAIPLSIKSFSHNVTRGEMAEMVYRLKASLVNKPSKSYESLMSKNISIGLPVRLKIPVINVDASMEYVNLTPEGAVGIPVDPANVAWYDLSPRPGDIGSSVVTGHINWYHGVIGVFANLHKLKPGDKITTQDTKGTVITFVVRETRVYDASANAIGGIRR